MALGIKKELRPRKFMGCNYSSISKLQDVLYLQKGDLEDKLVVELLVNVPHQDHSVLVSQQSQSLNHHLSAVQLNKNININNRAAKTLYFEQHISRVIKINECMGSFGWIHLFLNSKNQFWLCMRITRKASNLVMGRVEHQTKHNISGN